MTDLHADALLENVKTVKTALGCVCVALLALGLTYGGGYWHGATVTARKASAKGAAAIAKADQAKGERDALTKLAQAKDAEIAAMGHGLAKADANVAKTKAELEAYRAEHPNIENPDPSQPLQSRVDELAGMVVMYKDSEQAHVESERLKDALIADLAASRDLHKARGDAAERESLNLRAANAAKDGLIRAAEIKGFCWGLGFGAATGGYAGYRVGRR